MKGFAKTDVGKAREMNQDYYSIPSSESDLQLYILADGMGGYNGGEIASRLAAETTKNYIQNNFKKIEHDKEAILKLIKDAMEYANMVVYEESKKDQNLQGMGTTLDVCFIYNSKIYIGHVGDSRIYLIKKDIARKITKDHSYVQQLVEDKKITREEAEHHPKKNMLLKALGCTSYVEPDIRARNLEKDDILLMCSDGLTNMVEESKIYEVVRENKEKAPEILVNLANNAGGYDNITVITII
jgi:serine/threonine protein phosphatase PrpC